MQEPVDLIDKIYEAAVVPDVWPDVLNGLSGLAEGDGALLFTLHGGVPRSIGTEAALQLLERSVKEGWQSLNDRADRLFANPHAGFLNDLDVYTREEIDRHPFFAIMRSHGYGWGAATAIPVPTGDMIAIDVERRFDRGPVERTFIRRLDALRPHLARAALITTRLQHERVRAAAEALELVGIPAAVVGFNQRPLAINSRFGALLPDVVQDRRERITLADRTADRLLGEALAGMLARQPETTVKSLPVAARDERPPMIVHLIPVRRSANDIFSGAFVLMAITPVVPKEVPNADVLQGLFDLTPAEARIARALARHGTVDAVASTLGLSRETVRTHLKRVMGKTGTSRQVELASLLGGGVLFGR